MELRERIELLPCPFCGGHPDEIPASRTEHDNRLPCVECRDCGAQIQGRNRLVAVERWNTRSALLQTAELRKEGMLEAADAVPTSWLDSLLTGPDAVLKGKGGTWGCPDIEALLRAVKARIRSLATKEQQGVNSASPQEQFVNLAGDSTGSRESVAALTREQIETCRTYGLHAAAGDIDERVAFMIALCDMALRSLDSRDALQTASNSDNQSAVAPADERSAGYVVVPREPTEDMYRATSGLCDAYGFNHATQRACLTYETIQGLWKALLSAAPPSPDERKDAERYRFVRDAEGRCIATDELHPLEQLPLGEKLDAAIDAALSEKG